MACKEVRRLLRSAEAQGFEVALGGGGHYRLRPPDRTRGLVFVSATPSEPRAMKNALALLRRAGYKEEK